MKKSRILTLLLALSIALFLLSFSIAAPILCRPFYYAHIKALDLCSQTGLSESQIREAFDEMLDYCLGGEEFSTGCLPFSQSGKSHFTDVRRLFLLDLWILGISGGCTLLLLTLPRLWSRRPARLRGHGPAFWAGTGLGSLFLLLGLLASLDFNKTFVLFHALFFPGKDNWMFDPAQDAIIQILPEAYFQNCAILILAILLLGCGGLILADCLSCRKKRKN